MRWDLNIVFRNGHNETFVVFDWASRGNILEMSLTPYSTKLQKNKYIPLELIQEFNTSVHEEEYKE